MNTSINLLKPSERRYQGPVSGKFIAFTSIFLALATIILISSYLLFTMYIQKGQLKWARESLAYLEPSYKNLVAVRNSTSEIDNLLKELSGWSHSSLEAERILDEIQEVVPEDVQLTNLSLRYAIGEPKTPPKEGEVVAAFRLLRMGLGGLSHGDTSESAVIDLISDLRGLGGTNAVFGTVTLNSMQKDRISGDARSFSISAEGTERELK
jgi:hypothetical protein